MKMDPQRIYTQNKKRLANGSNINIGDSIHPIFRLLVCRDRAHSVRSVRSSAERRQER